MNRDLSLQAIKSNELWDILVIGGGATGLGAAVDAAARGYRTVLIEARDFASGTSSRSTKLIHGGVRYLRQGNISLVRESLRERALLLRNAPALSRKQAFIVPAYGMVDRPFYGIGLKLYDALAGHLGLSPTRLISRENTIRQIPGIRTEGLRGGVEYYDGQFDDARLAVALASTLHRLGGFAVNYVPAKELLKESGRVCGAVATDVETGAEVRIRARVVINATGVFTDALRQLDERDSKPLVSASQGAHIVVDRSFLQGSTALMVPKTKDGRVLFAIPWQDHVVIGTTDTPIDTISPEPRPLAAEIEFLLEHAALYLSRAPSEKDILSAFAGLRPLVKASDRHTAQLSRDHAILVSESGLVTITGGKWTTYRKMGEDVITRAAEVGDLPQRASATENLALEGSPAPELTESSIAGFMRDEMARDVEDILARRTRLLFLNARAAIEKAPFVSRLLSRALNKSPDWEQDQLKSFEALAQGYRWPS